MKVLLVHPAAAGGPDRLIRLAPMGLAYVAGALREAGHEVRIVDAAGSPSWEEDLGRAMAGWRPEAAGISASTVQMGPALALASRIKGADPRIPVILGGVHPTLFPGEVLRDGAIDFAVHGEGERTAVELLAAVAGSGPLDRIPGIAFRDRGRPRVNGPRPPIADLDGLPFPAYDLLPLGSYTTPFSAPGHVMSMVTSRGCPYPCIFCDAFIVHGKRYRAHSAERVVEEIRHLTREFGIREIVFKDSEFTLDRDRVARFCDLLVRGGPRVTWTASARVDHVDRPLLEEMARAGCRVIQFGVESADPAVLETLKKRITIEKVREAFRAAREAGIETVCNLMTGSPGETRGSIQATLRLVREIRPDFLNVQVLVPYPGTELHDMIQRRDRGEDGGLRPAVPLVSAEEARRRRRKLLRSFYLRRPGLVLGRVLTLSPVRWRQNFAAVAEMLRSDSLTNPRTRRSADPAGSRR